MSPKTLSKAKDLFKDFFPAKEVIAFTSDRQTDFTRAKDSLSLTEIQKSALEEKLGMDCPTVVNVRQVHGNRIVVADEDGETGGILEADGIITKFSKIAIAVRTADCYPIFLYDSKKKIIALVHAGWRGSEKGIVKEAVKTLKAEFKSNVADIRVALGPGIRSCCYQVSEGFLLTFPMETATKNKQCYLDLAAVNKNQLLDIGLKQENIFDCGVCTCCNENYFSYRREGEKAGRMISAMMLK